MKPLKKWIFFLFLMGVGGTYPQAQILNKDCIENSPKNNNLAKLHRVGILGEKDHGLKFDDVFRKLEPREIKPGGPYEATGVLMCWSSKLKKWKSASGFVVRNKKKNLRLISVKHVLINGDSKDILKKRNLDTSNTCFFSLAHEYQKGIRLCKAPKMQDLVNCLRWKGLAFSLLSKQHFSKPIVFPPKADLAVLKFAGQGPKVTKPMKLKKLNATGNFSVASGPDGRSFLRIPGQGRYVGEAMSLVANVVTQKSCSVYPRNKKDLVKNDNIMSTDCHTVRGFSGGPVAFTNIGTGAVRVGCVMSGHRYASGAENTAFNKMQSVNVCQAITDEVLDLLEK